ncbi:MAG: porin [Myxococcota bacterium]
MRVWICLGLWATTPAMADETLPKEGTITPLVQMQLWGTAFDQDEDPTAETVGYGDPGHDMGFSVRRLRLGFEGHRDAFDFQVDVGLSAPYDGLSGTGRPRFEVVNAFARGSWVVGQGVGRTSVGMVRVPFTRERLMSSRELVFQERAVGTAWIAPSQDLGILFDYELDMGVRAQVGVYNGGGDLFGDDNLGVLLAGRLEYARGDTYRTYGESDDVDVGVAVAGLWNQDVATQTVGGEVDALVRVWRVTLLAEVMTAFLQPGDSTVDMPGVATPTQRLGITGQLSWWTPLDAVEAPAAERSAVELAARVATFNDNVGIGDNGDVLVLHSGATWRNMAPGVDLGAGFIHREEMGGRTVPNDTVRLWGQVRWPARPVRTTADSIIPSIPVPANLPGEAEMHPTGNR